MNTNTLFNIKETALNTLNEGVTLSANTVIGAKHLSCSCEGYHVYKVMLNDECNAQFNKVSVVRQGENNFLRNANLTDMLIKTSDGQAKSYKNFTTDYIIVKMDNMVANTMQGRSLYVDYNTGYVARDRYSKEDKEYVMLMYTSSGVKKNETIWYDKSLASTNMDLINAIIPGVIDEMKKDLSLNASLKFASRPGLAWTPNVNFFGLNRVATFDGNFDNINNTSDGQVYMKASYAQKMFKLHNIDEACKLVIQARIHGVMKFQVIVVPDELLLEMLDNLRARGRINYLGDGNNTNMLLDSNAIKCHIKPSNLVFSIMSIGKVTTSQTSKQLLEKVIIEAQRQNRLEEVVEYINQQGIKQVARLISDILSQDIKEVSLKDEYILDVLAKTNPSNPIVNAKRVEDAYQTIKNIIDGLNIEFVDEDNKATMFNTVVAGDITATFGKGLIPDDCVVIGKFSKMMDKNPELKEKYGKFIGIKYPSMFINEFASGKVLTINEMINIIHASDLPQRAKRGLTIYFRNMSDATIMFPASRDIFNTCAGMDTDFDKLCVIFDKMIVDLLFNKQEVLNISSATPKDLEQIKYVSKSLARELNSLNKAIETNTSFNIYDNDFYGKMFCKQIETDDSIGSITKANNRTIALLSECMRGNFAPAKNFLIENLGTSKNNKLKYEVTRDIVDIAYVDDMINKMQYVIWNKENIINFLTDCSRVFRLYQETQIDGAKTGIYLERRLTAKTIKPTSCMSIEVKEVNGVTMLVRNIPEMKAIKTKHGYIEPIVFEDILGGIQSKLVDVANIEFRQVIEINKNLFAYTNKQVKEFNDLVTKLNNSKEGKKLLSSLATLKSTYTSLTADYIKSVNDCTKDGVTDEDKLHVIKETYTTNCKSIGNSIRVILNKLRTKLGSLKGAVVLAIGCTRFEDNKVIIDAHSKNRFAYNCVPELVYAYLIGKEYKVYGTILQTGKEVEGLVELVNGVSKNGLIIKERYTGMVEFKNDTVSVIKEIETIEPTNEFNLIVPVSEVSEIEKGDEIYRLTKNPVHFDGNGNKKYTTKNVTKVTIDVNKNRGTEYKAFWKRTECYVITVA